MELSSHSCEENRTVKLNIQNMQHKTISTVVQSHLDQQAQNRTSILLIKCY